MKTYLGDAVYAEFDGYGITLTTENGIRATNTIYVEPAVYGALVAFVNGLKTSGAERREGKNERSEL